MMMKVLLDTNILLDAHLIDRPWHELAEELLNNDWGNKVHLFASALSLKDVYYILCKFFPEKEVRGVLNKIFSIVTILPVDTSILKNAVSSNEPDFEDGIIRACAEENGIDFIITRDMSAYEKSTIRSMDSEKFYINFIKTD